MRLEAFVISAVGGEWGWCAQPRWGGYGFGWRCGEGSWSPESGARRLSNRRSFFPNIVDCRGHQVFTDTDVQARYKTVNLELDAN